MFDSDNSRPPPVALRPTAAGRYAPSDRAGLTEPDETDADDCVQLMARRQLAISLIVAFALLALAGLRIATASYEIHPAMAERHTILRAETPRKAIAAPGPGMMQQG